jgi:hypothetical protein
MSITPGIHDAGTAPELRLTPDAALNPASQAGILVCLPLMDAVTLESALAAISTAFRGEDVQVALSQHTAAQVARDGLQIVPYKEDRTQSGWVLAAADYAAVAALVSDDKPQIALVLSDNLAALRPDLLQDLVECARRRNVDLVLPRFMLGPNDGLVNSALLYPLTRALFGADIRFPLPVEAALSHRMLQRLGSVSRSQVGSGQGSSLLWPVAEAAVAGFSVRQVEAAADPPVISGHDDFNALFNSVAGSLFSDIENKASFWQRARSLPPRTAQGPMPAIESSEVAADIQPMIESFHLAQANLQEIWSLVLPPQSRLALKKLSLESPGNFAFEPDLWARVTYDFVLAFHLRTLNRGHLLGALIPLYMAWVASHLHAAADDASRAARHIDDTASAFETEKSYLVARWRWPDRFNP